MCDFFFSNFEETESHFIKKCKCGITRKVSKTASGFSNLFSHITTKHSGYEEELACEQTLKPGSIQSFLGICEKSKNVFSWIEWIINDDLPFSFVDSLCTKKYSNLKSISSKTLEKYIVLLSTEVKKQIASVLPEKFSIIFDGWTSHNVHYIALFACFLCNSTNEKIQVLLSFSPLLDETSMSAFNHCEFINSSLENYGKSIKNVVCLTGDNCSTNKKISKDLNCPLVGCYYHRLNLFCKKMFSSVSPTLDKISSLMSRLSTIKNKARLKKYTDILPVKQNVTRWGSTEKMISRFYSLKEFLPEMLKFDKELGKFFPTVIEEMMLDELKIPCKLLNIATTQLQNNEFGFLDARNIYDVLIENLPLMNLTEYLGVNAAIITAPAFESGIIKIMQGNEDNLTAFEKQNCSTLLLKSTTEPADFIEMDSEKKFLQEIKKRRIETTSNSKYLNLKFIAPTSTSVERLFSQSKNILRDNRCRLLPERVEALMILKANKNQWNVSTVHEVINK